MEDARIGRFRSVDPLTQKYPWLTPYQFSSNTPIWATDLDGKEAAATSQGINWGYVWGSIGADGNDDASSKDYAKKVIIPALKHVAIESGKALLMMTPGLEEEGVELELGEITVAADATRVERPFIPEEPVEPAPGSTKVQKSTSTEVEGANQSAETKPVKQSKVEKSTKTETVGGKYTKKTKASPGRGPGQSRSEMEIVKIKKAK